MNDCSSNYNFISKLPKGNENPMAFCSTVKKTPLTFSCWKSQLWVCFKSRICNVSKEKVNVIFYQADEEKWKLLQLTLDDSKSEEGEGNYYDQTINVQANEILSFSNMNFSRFFSEGSSKIFWFLRCLQQEFAWTWLFWVFKLSRVKSVYDFPKLTPQLYVKP